MVHQICNTYNFTDSPYHLSDLPLGTLVSDTHEPIFDKISAIIPTLPADYSRRSDTAILYNSSSTLSPQTEVTISSIFNFRVGFSHQAHICVEATAGYVYYLNEPRQFFKRNCEDGKVRQWIQQGYGVGQKTYFVTGYRTLIDVRVSESKTNSSVFEIRAEAPAELLGGISLGGKMGWEAGRGLEQERTFSGERIYAVCYRKVGFRFLKGPETAFLKVGRPYWESYSRSLGENSSAIEIVEVNVDELVNEGSEGIDKMSVEDGMIEIG